MCGNLHIPPDEWLGALFEYEFCAECGGDAKHHTAVPFMGNWFAHCDYPRLDTLDTAPLHPVIDRFHRDFCHDNQKG